MVITLDQYTFTKSSLMYLLSHLQKQLEQKSFISNRIMSTKGGEQLSWIKKYNGLFIHQWGLKRKKLY